MSAFELQESNGIKYYSCGPIAQLGFVRHAFSTRVNGTSPYPESALNLGYTRSDAKERVDTNRDRFLRALGCDGEALKTLKQVHSNTVHVLNRNNKANLFQGDGFVTAEPGVLLAVLVADCHPILLIDPIKRVVANLHAGWRGTASRIAERGVEILTKEFNSSPQDLMAAIGPGIGACCYEVGEEVVETFYSEFGYADQLVKRPSQSGKVYLNLSQANTQQLIDSGLREEKILKADMCTSCRNDLFFSHRRERGHTGRMMAVVGIEW